MGLLASLLRAMLGEKSARRGDEQPSELTAVAPGFSGFVSNRPRKPAGDRAKSAVVAAPDPPAVPRETAPAQSAAPPAAGESEPG